MPNITPPTKYAPIICFLHWLVAFLLLCQIINGFVFDIDDSIPHGAAWLIHAYLGLGLVALMLTRLFFRFVTATPPMPDNISGFEKKIAKTIHGLLYLIMILTGISGYLYVSLDEPDVLPASIFLYEAGESWLGKNMHDTAEFFEEMHETLIWILLGLVGLHIIGFLKHSLTGSHNLIRRIW